MMTLLPYTRAEEVAHQLEVWLNTNDMEKHALIRKAIELLRAALPAEALKDEVIVPREPTEQMLLAAHDCVPITKDAADFRATAKSIYACMLAATQPQSTRKEIR